MGGNLLKNWNLEEKRLPDKDYQRLKSSLVAKLQNDFHLAIPNSLKVGVSPCVRDKSDHGDLDIIMADSSAVESFFQRTKYLSSTDWKGIDSFSAYLEREFGYKPHKNSNVYSFPVEGFQVDITLVPFDEYETTISYTSWGDLGNLMGRIYHKMGLHYGHNGLSFWIRQGLFDKNVAWSDNDHVYDKMVVSTNTKEIFELGGFDYDRWLKGFDSESDVADFIISSEYFDPKIYALENLNNINRVRNKKRGMYMRFLEKVQNKEFPSKKKFLGKGVHSLLFQKKFPQLKQAIDHYRFEYQVSSACKEKLNGDLVKLWLGTSDGPTIGKVMKWAKSQMTNETILKTPQEDIVKMVLDYVEKEGIEIVKDQPQQEKGYEFFPLVDFNTPEILVTPVGQEDETPLPISYYLNGYDRHRLKLFSSGMAGDVAMNKYL